jgi:hypothetical protein
MITMKFEGGAELAKVFDSLSLRLGKKVLHEALREAAEPIRVARRLRTLPRISGSETHGHQTSPMPLR